MRWGAWLFLLAGAGCRAPSSVDAGATAAAPSGPGDPCAELAARLCQVYGSASELCAMVTQRAPRFTATRCARKLEGFEEEVATLDRLQAARRVLASPGQLLGDRAAPALGASDAPLTLVEFSDFTCSDCARASLMARAVEHRYGDQVRFVFRQFPRATSPQAELAAEASLEAHAQGRFWPYHDILFANPHDLTRAALVRYAGEVGLDRAALEAALADGRHRKAVEADRSLGRDALLAGPPALFVEGTQVSVPFSVTELFQLIDEALSATPARPRAPGAGSPRGGR